MPKPPKKFFFGIDTKQISNNNNQSSNPQNSSSAQPTLHDGYQPLSTQITAQPSVPNINPDHQPIHNIKIHSVRLIPPPQSMKIQKSKLQQKTSMLIKHSESSRNIPSCSTKSLTTISHQPRKKLIQIKNIKQLPMIKSATHHASQPKSTQITAESQSGQNLNPDDQQIQNIDERSVQVKPTLETQESAAQNLTEMLSHPIDSSQNVNLVNGIEYVYKLYVEIY